MRREQRSIDVGHLLEAAGRSSPSPASRTGAVSTVRSHAADPEAGLALNRAPRLGDRVRSSAH